MASAQEMYDAKATAAEQFCAETMDKMWELAGVDGCLLYPASILVLAKELQAALYERDFFCKDPAASIAFSMNAEYTTCVIAALDSMNTVKS